MGGWETMFAVLGKTQKIIRTKLAVSFREEWLKKCLLHGQVGPFPLPNSVAPLIVWRGRGVFRQFSAASFQGETAGWNHHLRPFISDN